MKKLFVVLFSLTMLSTGFAQTKLTAADWQSDLRFLQQTVHKDFSFLFKNITAKDFDKEVETLYKAIPSLQEHEIMAGFARIVSSFKYGHTDIGWRHSPIKYHVVPVNFYWFSDGIYVEGTDRKHEKILGARLVKVEGKPIEQALAAIKPLVPAENEQYFKANGLDYLVIPEAIHAQKLTKSLKNTITYTLEKDGKTSDFTLEAVVAYRFPRKYGFVSPDSNWISLRKQEFTPYYLKQLDRIYYYEYLPEQKTLYVRHSQIQDDPQEDIPSFYARVFDFIEKNDVQKLVLDVRLNGGGNNYKNKPIVTGIVACKKINKLGNLFVIIGRRTFSACQNLVNELHNYTNAVFVGEPTSENINFYGDTRQLELPRSKVPVFLSFAWWQDKPQWENAPWLAPHVAIEMSLEDYKSNKDPILDACLNFSDKDLVLDPMARLRDLFMAGKLDEMEGEARKMISDPRYRYVDFEGNINRGGYSLLNANQVKGAIFVFELNTRLYPKSANTWDSLAEAYLKDKQTDKAIEYYTKAMAMDPGGVTGQHAKSMLEQIKAHKAY